MLERWLNSYPELRLLDLDVGRGVRELRKLHHGGLLTHLLMPNDEKVIQQCLTRLTEQDELSAAAMAINEADRGALLPDIFLLAGAFHLAEGNLEEAVRQLRHCYQITPEPGLVIRRLLPSLRFLLRITPCVLVPLYPNAYGAELMMAVALWRLGEDGEALEVLREMVGRWGLHDEIRLCGGIIHQEHGRVDRAIKALTTSEETQRDALEMARAMYLAEAHREREEFRSAARVLSTALALVRDVNPHLLARARQLLAELYERNGMLLNALRESGRVPPNEMPGDVAAFVLAREERWVTELSLLSAVEIERLARADDYLIFVPDSVQPAAAYSNLDTTRDPSRHLKPKEMSWIKRREEERQIASLKAAAARGETVQNPQASRLSHAGLELQARIEAAERWWPGRRQALQAARPNEKLAISDPAQVGHLRFDFCGGLQAPTAPLTGEKRARMLVAMLGASLLIFVVLWLMQTCVY